jgi:hypothetical protein
VKNIRINFEISVELDVVGLGFLINEDDGLAVRSSIDTNDVSDGRDFLILSLEDNLEVLNSA